MLDLGEQQLPLHTRQNWPIPNTTAPEKPAVSRRASVEIWRELCPNAVLRSITGRYNCMGMVFAMTLEEIYGTIESPRFAAKLTIASNLKTFVRAARREEVVSQLAALSSETDLFNRIHELVNERFDDSCQNPLDAAVAVYLWVLWSHNESSARAMAEEIARTENNRWWWAQAMAIDIVNPTGTKPATLDRVQVHFPVPPPGEQNQGDVHAVNYD
jgi:hypothetical protein